MTKKKKIPIPSSQLDKIINDFKRRECLRVNQIRFKVNNQRTRGLNAREKKELRDIVILTPNNKLDTEYKRKRFHKHVFNEVFRITSMREYWEFGAFSGYREIEILDRKFPSLVYVTPEEFKRWLEEQKKS